MDEDKYHEYLDSYINIGQIQIEESMDTLEIEFNPITENVENYYKLEIDDVWKKYSDTVDLRNTIDINDINFNIDEFDIKNINIYAKQVDKAGNTLINSKIQDFSKLKYKLNVFNDVSLSGKTLGEYGFTALFNNSEDSAFQVGNFQAGHHNNSPTYSGTFRLNDIKYKPNRIAVNFYQYCGNSGHHGYVQSTLRVVYKDGTNSTVNTAATTSVGSSRNYLLTIDVEDKEISYIEMCIAGRDPDYSNSYGKVTSIVFYGIQLPVEQ